MITYKKILKSDESKLRDLINQVMDSLERPEFFIPFSDVEFETIFDEDVILIDGAYAGDKLVGVMMLFVNQNDLASMKLTMDIENLKAAELGGALVLPEFRDQSIAPQMAKKLIEDAKNMGFEYIFATSHPDNISVKAMQKGGLELVCTDVVADKYLRNFYGMKL